jgi:SPX domain protein involved in polyphosphate accumulation
MSDQGQTIQRLEQKYVITAAVADALQQALVRHCDPDPYNGSAGSYPVQSLYLDTPTLAFHHAKLRDDPDRFKLRVRTYGPSSAAHLEIKRKVLNVVDKARVMVARDQVARAVAGQGAPLRGGKGARRILGRFGELVGQTGAQPYLLVRYARAAFWGIHDLAARVTLDRQVQVQRVNGWDLDGDPTCWLDIQTPWPIADNQPPVVLELKYEAEMPPWMLDLISAFGLTSPGFSKYGCGVETCAGATLGVSASHVTLSHPAPH